MNHKDQSNGAEYVHTADLQQLLVSDFPVLNLPCDRPRLSVLDPDINLFSFQVVDPIATKLKTLAQQKNTELDILLLSTFQVFLSRYSAQEDVCIGFARCHDIELSQKKLLSYLDALFEQLFILFSN